MNKDEKKPRLTLTVTTVQTLETKAVPSYDFSSDAQSHRMFAECPTGKLAAVAYY